MKEIRDLFQDFTCQICYRPYSKQCFPIIVCQSFHIICVQCNEDMMNKFQENMEQQEYQDDWRLDCPFCKIPMIQRVYFPKLFNIKDIVCEAEANSQKKIKELEQKVQRLEKDNKALVEEKQGKSKAMKNLFQSNACLKMQIKDLEVKIKQNAKVQERFLPSSSEERPSYKNIYIYDLISKQKNEERPEKWQNQENSSISCNTSQRRAVSSKKDKKPDPCQYQLKGIKKPAGKQFNRQNPEAIKPFILTCYRQTTNLSIKKLGIKK